MKKLFLISVMTMMVVGVIAEDFRCSVAIYEYRWGNSKFDFHAVPTSGTCYVHINKDLGAYVSVSCPQQEKTFAVSREQILNASEDEISGEIEIKYRYGSGELHLTIRPYNVVVSYFYGDKYRIWKARNED